MSASHQITEAMARLGVAQQHLDQISGHVGVKTCMPGTDIISQGAAAPDIYLITRGLVKLHYVTENGKSFIKSFHAEGSFVGSLTGHVEQQDSSFSITCLEETSVEYLAYSHIQNLFSIDLRASAFGLAMYQALALRKEKREHDFLCLSADQQYTKFEEEHAGLLSRLKLQDIAAYLGITPVALSRIRKRLGRK